MAIKNVKIIESDLSGEPGAETVIFGLRGEMREIDLTPAERRKFEKTLSTWIEKSRAVSRPMVKHVPETTAEERSTIREWGRAQGMHVPDHGRIPKAVLKAYAAAHPVTWELEPAAT